MNAAVVLAIFTIDRGHLSVLLIERAAEPAMHQWALPGGALAAGESLDGAAIRKLSEETGVGDVYLEQLYTFDNLGEGAADVAVAYFALVDAMESKEVEGIARWVMRKRPYVGALRVRGDHLALIAMRTADQVVQLPELRLPKEKQTTAKELALAEQLVSTLEGEFDPEELHDTYKDRLLDLVKTKARGGKVKLKRPPARRTADESLADALRRSVAAAKG